MSADRLTVVVPVFNEADGIREFHRRLTAVLADLPTLRADIVYVDDGSRDNSFALLTNFAQADPRVTVLRLSRNFGHQAAITCGLDQAKGDAVVILDADLQDPPEVIPAMVEAWRAGADVAYGVRISRAGETWFKLTTAKYFYRLLHAVSSVDVPADAGDFRLMSRRVVDAFRDLREESRYVRGLVSWLGFQQVAVPYERDSRSAGETHYPLRRMLRLAIDGVTSFSEKPLRLATGLGALVSASAFAVGLYIVIAKLVNPDESVPGFASLATIVLFLGGVQLLAIGVLGEYMGRIFRESKHRPLYIVMDRVSSQPDVG